MNQKKQKISSDWCKHKTPTSVTDVSITNYQTCEMSTSIDSLATQVKNQDNRLKRILSKQIAENMTPTKFSAAVRESLRLKTATMAHLFMDNSSQLIEIETSHMSGTIQKF